MSIEFNPKFKSSLISMESDTPSISEKEPAVKDVVETILAKLGEQGLNSWGELDVVARESGIHDPKTILSHHCAMETLEEANYKNAEKRNYILVETLLSNSHLPLEDLRKICSCIDINRLKKEEKAVLIERHLSSLGINGEAISYWKKHLLDDPYNSTTKSVVMNLVLLRDKALFENKENTLSQGYYNLGLALSQLKTEEGMPLFSDREITTFLSCNEKDKISILAKLSEDPKLFETFSLFYGLKDPGAFLEVYTGLEESVPDRISRVMVAMYLTREKQGMNNHSLKALFNGQRAECLEEFTVYFLEDPKRLTLNVINLLSLKGTGWGSKPLIDSVHKEPLIKKMTESREPLSGISLEETQQLLIGLFSKEMNSLSSLALFYALYGLEKDDVSQFTPYLDKEELPYQVTVSLLMKRNSGGEPLLTMDLQRALLQLLSPKDRLKLLLEIQGKSLTDSEKGKLYYKQLFEGFLTDVEEQKVAFISHLKLIGVESKDIDEWEKVFNNKEHFKDIPQSVLEKAILFLPFLQDQEAFQLDLSSEFGPVNSFLKRAMALEDEEGTPRMLEMGIEKFLGRSRERPKGYFRMIILSLQNPKFLKILGEYKNYRNTEYDIEAIETGLKLYANPRIALAWALSSVSNSEFGSNDICRVINTELSPEEWGEFLLTVITNPKAWDEKVVRLLTGWDFEKITTEQAKEILSAAMSRMELDSRQMELCVKVLLSRSDKDHPTWLALCPYLLSLTPEDKKELDFRGSSDRLLISLLVGVLKKSQPMPYAPKADEKIRIINSLTDSIALKLNTYLTTSVKDTERVLSDLCRMSSIGLGAEETARNSWEMYSKGQMERLDSTTNQTELAMELEKKWRELESLKPEAKPSKWLTDLESEGWEPQKVLGRTHLYKHAESGKILAVKWQKLKEDERELFKEHATLEVIAKHQKRLGLLSQYPKPLGVYQFKGELPEGYFKDTLVKTRAGEKGDKAVAYVYEFPNEGYFTYLNDPMESSSKTEISRAYAKARQALIADLFVLAKNGLIMTQLADIFHRSEESRGDRDDRGRYMTMNFLVRDYALSIMEVGDFTGVGNGRLHHLETAVKYPNAGYSGLRDIGDSLLLKDFSNPEFEFNKIYFNKILKENPEKATTYILANFLAEYLLVYELIITERRVQNEENQLDWKDDEKVKELAGELKEGFINAMRYYSGLSNTVTKRFIENASIDWIRAAKQLHFFSRNDEKGYLPHNTPELMPEEIYGRDVTVKEPWTTVFWPSEEGMSDGGETRHRGTVSGTDPVKEPEKGRVILMTHMLVLEKARKEALKLRLLANARFFGAKGTIDERKEALEALKMYEESLELWPFDKETYKSLFKVHKVLGNEEKAMECKKEWAALTIQNSWENYLRKNEKPIS